MPSTQPIKGYQQNKHFNTFNINMFYRVVFRYYFLEINGPVGEIIQTDKGINALKKNHVGLQQFNIV